MKAEGNWSPRIQERGAKGTKAGSADVELHQLPITCANSAEMSEISEMAIVLGFVHPPLSLGEGKKRKKKV